MQNILQWMLVDILQRLLNLKSYSFLLDKYWFKDFKTYFLTVGCKTGDIGDDANCFSKPVGKIMGILNSIQFNY